MQGGTYFRNEIGAALFLEVEMSKLFCVSPGLRVLERQMQQPPGVQTKRIWYLCDGCGLEEQGKLF